MFKKFLFIFLIFQVDLSCAPQNDHFGFLLFSFTTTEALDQFKSEINTNHSPTFTEYSYQENGIGTMGYTLVRNLSDLEIQEIIHSVIQELNLGEYFLFLAKFASSEAFRDSYIHSH